jgi:D-arabinose 1-dehydrogenase-like Zn-dependent alcohol dehydrogenase
MRARSPGRKLAFEELPQRPLGDHEILVRVAACGVCRTDLHLADGELPNARYPVTPGHEVVGFADHAIADSRYVLPVPPQYADAEAAPLLCAGLIGYRAYRAGARCRRPAAERLSRNV